MKNCCGNCECWDNTKFFDKKKGLCKFDAPIFSSDHKTRWPVTRENDWCGKHRFFRNEKDSSRGDGDITRDDRTPRQNIRSEPREYDPDRR